MKQIKILYISEFFFPINQVASIRATKFCKYLSQNPDISVSVVCRSYEDMATDFLLEKDVSKISQIFRVSVNQYGVRLVSKLRLRVRAFFHLRDSQRIQKVGLESSKKQSYSIKNEIGRLFRVFSDELACSAYIRNAKRVLRKSSVPDIIISSYGPKSSPILGGWYKKGIQKFIGFRISEIQYIGVSQPLICWLSVRFPTCSEYVKRPMY